MGHASTGLGPNFDMYVRCALELPKLSYVAQLETAKTLVSVFSEAAKHQREILSPDVQQMLLEGVLALKEWAAKNSRTRPIDIAFSEPLAQDVDRCFLALCN
jgi:hypothetical protein